MKKLTFAVAMLFLVITVSSCKKAKPGPAELIAIGDKVCDAMKKGDIDGFMGLMHPKMLEFIKGFAAAFGGKVGEDPFEKERAEWKKDAESGNLETCETVSAEETKCDAKDMESAKQMSIKIDKCGSIKMNVKLKGKEPNVDKKGKKIDMLPVIQTDGKWYLGGN